VAGPTVSIVIPTRDRGQLLLEAVSSAVSASPLEVIVVDDGSSDGSIDLVERAYPGVRIVRGPFGNAARARNAGAAQARGEVLGFLDSDDVLLPAKTGALPEQLHADPSLVLVHGMTEVIDANGALDIATTRRHRDGFARAARVGTDYPGLARFCMMFTSATAIRRASFDDVGGYDETLDAYEDLDLYLRLSLIGRLAYESDLAARYRVWPGNVDWAKTATWTARVAKKHLDALPVTDAGNARRSRYGLYGRLVQSYNVLGNRSATRRASFAAARTSPARAVRDLALWRSLLRAVIPPALLPRQQP
jgi:glycosyltransferase involved in cell wall biosynthesis